MTKLDLCKINRKIELYDFPAVFFIFACDKEFLDSKSIEKATQGAYFYDSCTEEYFYYRAENIERNFHGTGDTFASVFAGAVTKGFDIKRALKTAVDFTVTCIKTTLPEADSHKYGVKFEECIPDLIEKIK